MSKAPSLAISSDIHERRALHDAFRRNPTSTELLSAGIVDLGRENQRVILEAVRDTTEFDDNAPDDDHSIGDITVICCADDGEATTHLIFFKIIGIATIEGTRCVLSVLLASEWWLAGPPLPEPIDTADDDDDEPFITEVEDCTPPPEATARIRELNDQLRKTFNSGTVVVTAGIMALDPATHNRVMTAVKTFAAFTDNNDPWGEHEMGAFEIDGTRYFFKIDYYDLTKSKHSDDPSDPAKTERVLTIMLAEEY